jgi:hypothetical protein
LDGKTSEGSPPGSAAAALDVTDGKAVSATVASANKSGYANATKDGK